VSSDPFADLADSLAGFASAFREVLKGNQWSAPGSPATAEAEGEPFAGEWGAFPSRDVLATVLLAAASATDHLAAGGSVLRGRNAVFAPYTVTRAAAEAAAMAVYLTDPAIDGRERVRRNVNFRLDAFCEQIRLVGGFQLLALEQRRAGDLRLEVQIRGFLPQAASGFPGAPEVTEYISIAESRWRQQLAGLGRTLGVEMLIAFPDDDEPRRRVADYLREAQRLLGGSEIDSAMLQVRKALETIKNTSGWNWPGRKDRPDRTVDERWALIRSAMEDQASGAMHVDPGTRDYVYTRAEAEALIAMTAALLCVTP
jgi:hypothetical protein